MKSQLRSTIRRVRLLRQQLGLWLRPAQPWDGHHDAIVSRFGEWSGESDGRFRHDFLGVRTRPEVRWAFRADPAGAIVRSPPGPDQSYFELIVVLRAVVEAAGRSRPFVVAELGAGYGPWLSIAHAALRRLAERPPASLIAVEPDPQHFAWLRQHLEDNGIDPDAQRLLYGAVGRAPGQVGFVPSVRPDVEYGTRVTEHGRRGSLAVPSYTLEQVVDGYQRIDLLHVDVQGEEWNVLGGRAELLGERVRRVIVATHSRGIHRRVLRLLREAGWRMEFDFGFRARERTEFGDIWFVDGMLAAVNPRLDDASEPSA